MHVGVGTLPAYMALMRTPALLLMALALAAAPFASGCSASADDFEESEDALAAKPYAQKITSATGYKAFGTEGGGFGQAGRSMKFFIDARDPGEQEGPLHQRQLQGRGGKVPDYAKYHYDFAQQQLRHPRDNSEFNDSRTSRDEKRYFAGTIQTYELAEATAADLRGAALPRRRRARGRHRRARSKTIKAAFTIPRRDASRSSPPARSRPSRPSKPQLEALGFEALTHRAGARLVKYLPLNPGEAWGYLRIFPKDSATLRPTDIPVFDELPLDLSVVAGTITQVYQDVTSHVNLKSKERGTPNMVLPRRVADATPRSRRSPTSRSTSWSARAATRSRPPPTRSSSRSSQRDRTSPGCRLAVVRRAEPRLVRRDVPDARRRVPQERQSLRRQGREPRLPREREACSGRKSQARLAEREGRLRLVPAGFGDARAVLPRLRRAPGERGAEDEARRAHHRGEGRHPVARTTAARARRGPGLFYAGAAPSGAASPRSRAGRASSSSSPAWRSSRSARARTPRTSRTSTARASTTASRAKLAKTDNPDFSCAIVDERGRRRHEARRRSRRPCSARSKASTRACGTRAPSRSARFARLDHATARHGPRRRARVRHRVRRGRERRA